jgi:TolB-like protein
MERELEAGGLAGSPTTPGMIIGTPRYMSPEQARGLEVDSRTDLFSLGAVLYEMLANRPAVGGDTPSDLLVALLSCNPMPLETACPGCPSALISITDRALQKDRETRYQDAQEMIADLKKVRQGIESGSILPTKTDLNRLRFTVVLAGFAILLAALAFAHLDGIRTSFLGLLVPAPVRSIAVLPIEDLSHNSPNAYFSDGMTEQLITDLSKISALRVISRFSVMQYKQSHKSLPEIARELNVDAILLGSIMMSDGDLRFNAQLVRAKPQQNLWAETYQRALQDILPLQAELASSIASQVRVAITPDERRQLSKVSRIDTEAQDLYFQGKFLLNKGNKDDLLKAAEDFKRAIVKSPSYVEAYCGLASVYAQMSSFYLAPREAMPKVKAAALKALALDEGSSEAHSLLGFVKLYFDWDWPGAERELKRAIALNPSSADAHLLYEGYLLTLDRVKEALTEVALSHELDPLSLRILEEKQFANVIAREYDKAIVIGRQLNELQPTYALPHSNTGLAYAQKGDFRNAVAELETAVRLEDTPTNRGFLAHVRALAGDKAGAKRLIKELKGVYQANYMCPYEIATAYVSLNQKEEAYKWMEKGIRDRADCMVWLRSEPWMDGLRNDAQYQRLLKRIGLGR